MNFWISIVAVASLLISDGILSANGHSFLFYVQLSPMIDASVLTTVLLLGYNDEMPLE